MRLPWSVAADREAASDECQLDSLRREVARRLGIRGRWRSGLARLRSRLEESGRDWSHLTHGDEITELASEFPIVAGLSAGEVYEIALCDAKPPTKLDFLEEAVGWIESHSNQSFAVPS